MMLVICIAAATIAWSVGLTWLMWVVIAIFGLNVVLNVILMLTA